jgi:amino acid transporter
MEKPTLFLRSATGLVRAWSLFDSFIYSALSINVVTLGFYIWSFGIFFPGANLVTALLITTPFIILEVIAYAALISVMPRAGGDYVWQTRILNPSIGYILAITGYVFILWHWTPIYGVQLSYTVFAPLAAVLNNPGGAIWWTSPSGIFADSVITIAFVSVVIALGIKWYARIQKWSFYIGMVGLLATILILAGASNATFVSAFNTSVSSTFGVHSNPYNETLAGAVTAGLPPQSFTDFNVAGSIPLVALFPFFFLWPIWGASLYGEVRGANDFHRNVKALTASVLFTAGIALVLFLVLAKTVGWEFYNAANYLYWGQPNNYNYNGNVASPLPIFPYPGLLAGFLTNSVPLQLFLIIAMSFWFWGWSGTLFMTSTRVLFAASFDRALPSWIADVKTKYATPFNTIIVMMIPSLIFSYLYSYVTIGGVGFSTFVLDATLVIAVMYLGTGIVAALLPFRRKEQFDASPIAKYKWLVVASGSIFSLFIVFLLYEWATNSAYGVNSVPSAEYVFVLYVAAAILYVVMKQYRKRQGVNLSQVYTEIPVE